MPDGFVLVGDAFRSVAGIESHTVDGEIDELGHALAAAGERIASAELPAELVAEVDGRVAAFGASARFAVRSSSTIEDSAAGGAAGVFASLTNVPAREVWPAIRAVWTSALAPVAAAYARRRGSDGAVAVPVAVIVQRFVPGERLTVYTRPPGAPRDNDVWVQLGEHVRTFRRDDIDPAVAIALRAEHAIGARDGADVELVDDARAGTLWVVQARPIVHPAAPERTPPPDVVLAPLYADERRWTWDVAHNPDPLSPAQAGLVERVVAAAIAPWSLRVCGGYLYSAPRAEPARVTIDSREDLAARVAAIEDEMLALLETPVLSLDDAIAQYLAFYRVWACELGPLITAARAHLSPDRLTGPRPSAVESMLLASARGELDPTIVRATLGVLAPAWDVAVATFGERPGVLDDAIARARATLPAAGDRVRQDDGSIAHLAAELAERDDLWFARAQWLVRRALLARAAELAIDPDDICWLPLDEVMRATAIDRDAAHRRAAAARAAAERAARWAMPIVVGGPPPESGPPLRGIGTGGCVTGRVVRFASLASAVAVGAGDVVVARAITPALAVFVVGCAALVSETGGPLDHGAALARELGIPCVVGCRDAWTLLTDGMIVSVDGAAGTVTDVSTRSSTGR